MKAISDLTNGLGKDISTVNDKKEKINKLFAEDAIMDLSPIYKSDTWQSTYLKIFNQIYDDLLPVTFLTASPQFIDIMDSVLESIDVNKQEFTSETQSKIARDLLSYVTIKAYQHNGGNGTTGSVANLNNNFIYPSDQNSVVDLIEKLRKTEVGKNNFFLDVFAVTNKASETNNNTGLNLVESNTFRSLNGQQKVDLQTSFAKLYGTLETKDDALSIVNYMMVKDGLQITYGTLLDAVSPFVMRDYLDHIETANEALRDASNEKMKSVFGLTMREMKAEFITGYLSSNRSNALLLTFEINNIEQKSLPQGVSIKDSVLTIVYEKNLNAKDKLFVRIKSVDTDMGGNEYTTYKTYMRNDLSKSIFRELIPESTQLYVKPVGEIKEGVSELFDSNPELANEVYEALGFSGNKEETVEEMISSFPFPSELKLSHKNLLITYLEYNILYNWISNELKKEPLASLGKSHIGKDKDIKELSMAFRKNSDLYKKEIPLYIKKLAGKFFSPTKDQDQESTVHYEALEYWEDKEKNITSYPRTGTIIDFMSASDYYRYNPFVEENSDVAEDLLGKNITKSVVNDFIKDNYKKQSEITTQQKQQAIQLYSQYLDTIFPNSKVKDVVYHGSGEKIEQFKDEFKATQNATIFDSPEYDKLGFFFTTDKNAADTVYAWKFDEQGNGTKTQNINPSVVNVSNPQKTKFVTDLLDAKNIDKTKDGYIAEESSEDYYIETTTEDGFTRELKPYEVIIVPKSEQIHILGNKQDIKGFKEFVTQPSTQLSTSVNPLVEAGVKATDMYGNAAKDIQMADESTQFIGFGTIMKEGNVSSTDKYAKAWGNKANTGVYSSGDTIMVSGSGNFGRGGVDKTVEAQAIRKTLTEKYKPLLDKAIAAGASFRIGNQYSKGNLSDQLIADYLQKKGYTEEKLNGYSKWTSSTKVTQPSTSVEGFQGYKGNFEDKGKGTPQGDGKDKAMRQVANVFIGELSKNGKGSTFTSAKEIAQKQGEEPITSGARYLDGNENKYVNEIYSASIKLKGQPLVVMLARNGKLAGQELSVETKRKIKGLSEQGATFVVGDMPGVDSQFIDYLQEIGAKFTIYHTGTTPRIQVKPTTQPSTSVEQPIQLISEVGFYKGIPIIDTENITTAEGTKGAASYSSKNNSIKINRALLKKKYAAKVWTNMRELIETLHGEEVKSKAENLPANSFNTYEEFEMFVIEHEYQHSLYTRKDFNKDFPNGTKGEYETAINNKALNSLSQPIQQSNIGSYIEIGTSGSNQQWAGGFMFGSRPTYKETRDYVKNKPLNIAEDDFQNLSDQFDELNAQLEDELRRSDTTNIVMGTPSEGGTKVIINLEEKTPLIESVPDYIENQEGDILDDALFDAAKLEKELYEDAIEFDSEDLYPQLTIFWDEVIQQDSEKKAKFVANGIGTYDRMIKFFKEESEKGMYPATAEMTSEEVFIEEIKCIL
jgi:hypothetical protein